jgi:hypothetical protein
MRLNTLRQLKRGDYALLLIAVPLVMVVRLILWLFPSHRILRALSRVDSVTEAPIPRRARATSIVWAIESASRRIPRATCLTQAIAGKLLLRWFGYEAKLCLGVAPTAGGGLRAHAWLEREGLPILGGVGIRSLVRLPQLPTDPHLPVPFTR